MPVTTTKAEGHQARWDELVRDPVLRDLPYKFETNSRGQLILSLYKAYHSDLQEALQNLLRRHAPEGRQPPGFPIATSKGVKQIDVSWMSTARRQKMRESGDPPTLARRSV